MPTGTIDLSSFSEYDGTTTIDLAHNFVQFGNAPRLNIGSGIKTVKGTAGNDVIIAAGKGLSIDGGGGDTNKVDFSAGSYNDGSSGIYIRLGDDGVARTGNSAFRGDTIATLTNIQSAVGTAGNDVMAGGTTTGLWQLDGGAGDDIIIARGMDAFVTTYGYGGEGNDNMRMSLGTDVFFGGTGYDTADYRFTTPGVGIDLQVANSNTGAAEGDQYVGVERFFLTSGNDWFRGSNAAEEVWGFDGDNTFEGRGGDDRFYAGAGIDTFVYDAGNNGIDRIYGFNTEIDKIDVHAAGITNMSGVTLSGYGSFTAVNFAQTTLYVYTNGGQVGASSFVF